MIVTKYAQQSIGKHAIVGCAGAAASNQSCSAGAMGATAATLLTHLFSDPTPDETEAQRDAKANVVSSLVAGIAGMADPSAAATATVAAKANVDNN
jgi:filamentous hemagglutinin